METQPKAKKPSKTAIFIFHIIILLVATLLIFKYTENIQNLKFSIYEKIHPKTVENCNFDNYKNIVIPEDAWFLNTPMIYHAAGGIDGLPYTNSKEALEQTIQNGNNFVEIDFLFTSDHKLVCAHEWNQLFPSKKGEPPTLNTFLNNKIFGKYTPMTSKDIIQYMYKYPDLHIVIDTKESDLTAVIQQLINDCNTDPNIMKNFIIQLYDGEMKADIQNIYTFDDSQFLFTLYKFGTTRINEILKICYNENISVITLPYGKWDKQTIEGIRSKGFVIYEHTVNRLDEAEISLKKGVNSFYTDFLEFP